MDKKPEKQPRHSITLCDRLWAKAKKIGGGINASHGIRKALEAHKPKQEK